MGDRPLRSSLYRPDAQSDDRTVFQIKLPRSVGPNETVQFKIVFHDQFGQVVARTGYSQNFMMGAQWFPKIGVWWQGAWNCHQFHANTEFFADFGTYDVKLTVPQNEVVGASGVQVGEVANNDGTKTLTFRGEESMILPDRKQPDGHKVFESDFNGTGSKSRFDRFAAATHRPGRDASRITKTP